MKSFKGKERYHALWKKIEEKQNNDLQYEFLPSALEIVERPSSTMGRNIIYTIFGILITALLWSCISKVDEVAVARGKVVPDGRVKVLQPLEEGIITGIYVDEGQRVEQGQLLMELDTTIQKVDEQNIQKLLQTAKLERDLLEKILQGKDIQNDLMDDRISSEIKSNILELNTTRKNYYETKKQLLDIQLRQSKEQLEIAKTNLERLEGELQINRAREAQLKKMENAPKAESVELERLQNMMDILEKEVEKYSILYESGAVAKAEWEGKSNELSLLKKQYNSQKAKAGQEQDNSILNRQAAQNIAMTTQKEMELQKMNIQQAKSNIEKAQTEQQNLEEENKSQILNWMVEKNKEIQQLSSQLLKAEKSLQLQSLKSPANGIVQGISMNTIGGVATKAQPLMTIVPDDTPLMIEAYLDNKDIGFVREGQEVRVKLDTFSYQKYGTVDGIVVAVSPDAIEDEKRGLIYKMKISMKQKTISVEGNEVPVSSGMAVTAEIKTGKRRVIEFFLEPLLKNIRESVILR